MIPSLFPLLALRCFFSCSLGLSVKAETMLLIAY